MSNAQPNPNKQPCKQLRQLCKPIALLLALILIMPLFALADISQNNVQILNNITVTAPVQPAASITTAGGTFTTLLLNATTQTMRWKAYVGNVTGKFTLRDASNGTIYDWNIANIAGEVYASRNNSITWSSIRCAGNATVTAEQAQLNMSAAKVDSINLTFNNTVHKTFYVGTTLISHSTCRAVATYVNNTRQTATENAAFQEVLLDDTQSMVYATLLENKVQGYNNAPFDFQMIVAESDISATPSPYYFWVELS
jgi:cytochrome b561